MRRLVLFAFSSMLALGAPGLARAGDWTDAVFPERTHDFGTVARGSKIRHSFPLVNSTNQEIHIASWKAKCGCTDVRVGARDIPPGTKTVVEVVIDTTQFTGLKPSGLTLEIDRPAVAQVSLDTTCFIRSDVTINPGQADFGVVNRSTGPKIDMLVTYAGGKPDWAVTEMRTISDDIVAEINRLNQSAAGQVAYQLTVKLKPTAPVGFLKDEITLKTNDPNGPTIPVSVAANVQSNVILTPSVMNLGRLRPGDSIQKTVIVRSGQPFKVAQVSSSRTEVSTSPAGDESKPLHTLTLTFKAPNQTGPFNGTVEISTDLKDEPPAKLSLFATVIP